MDFLAFGIIWEQTHGFTAIFVGHQSFAVCLGFVLGLVSPVACVTRFAIWQLVSKPHKFDILRIDVVETATTTTSLDMGQEAWKTATSPHEVFSSLADAMAHRDKIQYPVVIKVL